MEGHLEINTPIANDTETTVFTLTPPQGTYTLTYNIAFQPTGSIASYQKGYMWIDNLEKNVIVSNLALPRDWPTSKEISTQITSDGTTPILIKALVQAEHPVELMHKHTVTEKDQYGSDWLKIQGCHYILISQ